MRTVQERFEAKFEKRDGNYCWNWTAYKDLEGYGTFWIAGRMQLAHRVAYQLYVGAIPEGLCICHVCDNPACINPSHLFPGTHTDNMRDCNNKGRGRPKCNWPDSSGEKHGRSKLTEEDIRTIRMMCASGSRQADLAREFGVTPGNISKIVCGRNWKKV